MVRLTIDNQLYYLWGHTLDGIVSYISLHFKDLFRKRVQQDVTKCLLLSYYPRGEINIQQQEDADLCTRKKKATTTTMHKMTSSMNTVTTTILMNKGKSTRFGKELMLELSMLKMLRQSRSRRSCYTISLLRCHMLSNVYYHSFFCNTPVIGIHYLKT